MVVDQLSTTLYNANLVGYAGSTTGKSATAEVTIDAAGGITSVRITNPGSVFGIGNTLAVTGIATTSGFVEGYVEVLSIFDDTNASINVLGVTSNTYSSRNTTYRVTGYNIGTAREIQVGSATSITGIGGTSGIGATVCARATVYNAGPGLGITSFVYDYLSGIATVGTGNTASGVLSGNVLKFVGADQTAYNGNFRVTEIIGISTFKVSVGVGTTAPTAYRIRNILCSPQRLCI